MDPSNTPLLEAPEGQHSNLINPSDTQMPAAIATSVCLLILVTLFVAMRTFTKLYLMREFHTEDYLSLTSWVFYMVYVAWVLVADASGLARHQWDISVAMVPGMFYNISILYILYEPVTLSAKLSVLFQTKRIFTTTRKDSLYWTTWTLIWLNIAFYVALFFANIFICWPREAFWNSNVKGTCVNQGTDAFASGIGNVISDIAALVLPIWGIFRLQTRVKQKLSIFAVFAVGSVAVIVGTIGLWVRALLLSTSDFAWVWTQLAMLAISEIGVVIIVGCMPCLPRLWRFWGQKIKGTIHGTSQTSKKSFTRLEPPKAPFSNPKSPPRTLHPLPTIDEPHESSNYPSNETLEFDRPYKNSIHLREMDVSREQG